MKKLFSSVFVFCFLLFFATTGWSYTILDDGTPVNVGAIDNFIAADNTLGNSGDETELKWVNDILAANGYTTTFTLDDYCKQDYEYEDGIIFDVYDGAAVVDNTYAFELEYEPQFFLVKFGDANSDFISHALWENNDELNWGVINLDGLDVKSITAFSHFAEVGGGVPVPEPATLLLLGTGLVGLAGVTRKKLTK